MQKIDSYPLNDFVKGIIELEVIDKKTRELIKKTTVNNIVTYIAPTVFTQALYGNSDYRITHIYGEHAIAGTYPEGSLPPLTALRTDTVDTLRTAPRTTANAESPLIFASFSTSDISLYINNVITFSASFDSDLLNGEVIVGAGLICKIGTLELLTNHAYFPGHVKTSSHELAIHWSLMLK